MHPKEKETLQKVGLDLSYHKREINRLPKENISSIEKSTLKQQYGKIFNPTNNHKDCMHCGETNHGIAIYSSKKTNKIIALFQKSFLENSEGGAMMIGSATIKYKGKLLASYVTHSGSMLKVTKEIFNQLNATILDYTNDTNEKEFLKILHPKKRKHKIKEECPLYAIHADNSLSINEGHFKTLYGKNVRKYENVEKIKESIHRNFTNCAAQKIMQQIAKDFSHDIVNFGDENFKIKMSEAWIQKNGENRRWSEKHPVHSCEGCVVIIPRSLCSNK